MALPSFGELMAAYGSIQGPGSAIQAGLSGYEKGSELATEATRRKLLQAQATLMESKSGAVDLYDELVRAGVPKETIAAAAVTPGTFVSPDQAKFFASTLAKKTTAEAGMATRKEIAERTEAGKTKRAGIKVPPIDPIRKAAFQAATQEHVAALRPVAAAAAKNPPGLLRRLGSTVAPSLISPLTKEQQELAALQTTAPKAEDFLFTPGAGAANPDQAALDYLKKNHPELKNPTPADIAWAKTKI
jgi:hypothetical protein